MSYTNNNLGGDCILVGVVLASQVYTNTLGEILACNGSRFRPPGRSRRNSQYRSNAPKNPSPKKTSDSDIMGQKSGKKQERICTVKSQQFGATSRLFPMCLWVLVDKQMRSDRRSPVVDGGCLFATPWARHKRPTKKWALKIAGVSSYVAP